jgi:methylthioribose-1-phosphate isomerase
MPRTLWWEDNQLKMIDQRLLPLTYTVLSYDNYRAVAQAITDMVVRGAPAIGAAGAYGMALAAVGSPATDRDSLLRDLTAAKKTLDASRPTAVNLSWATSRILDYAERLVLPNLDDVRSALIAEADRIADEDVDINRRMGAFGAEIVPHGANILTHCNAGSLATVDFGTVLGVIRAAHEQNRAIHVWVDETRPRLQGARLTAWELTHDEIPMTLIADNAAGMLMRLGRVQVVLFGADRVAANGDVANKIGSYKLGVLAKENGIPCYSVVPTPTIDLSLAHGDLIPIEERNPEEVTMVGSERIAPENVAVYNPAFDVTPHRYLTGIITEEGICYPPFEISLRKAVEAAEQRRSGSAG